VCQLDRHVTEPTDSGNRHSSSRASVPVLQRRVHRDARTQQRGRNIQAQGVGDAHDKAFGHDDVRAVSTLGDDAVFTTRVVRADALSTVLLIAGKAPGALATAIDHATDTHPITHCELGDLRANFLDYTCDFVPGYQRVLD
jgi:hypothetical protein